MELLTTNKCELKLTTNHIIHVFMCILVGVLLIITVNAMSKLACIIMSLDLFGNTVGLLETG